MDRYIFIIAALLFPVAFALGAFIAAPLVGVIAVIVLGMLCVKLGRAFVAGFKSVPKPSPDESHLKYFFG